MFERGDGDDHGSDGGNGHVRRGGTSGNVTLNLNTAATDARYPQLLANNTFTGIQAINNTTTMTGTDTNGVLQVTNTVASGSGPAIVATVDSSGAAGIKGIIAATTGNNAGVYGQTSSPDGRGVHGSGGTGVVGTSTIGPLVGVYGVSNGASQAGSGLSEAGVWGDTNGSSFAGVVGTADDGTAGGFLNKSEGDFSSALFAFNESAHTSDTVFDAEEGAGGSCIIDVTGDLFCSGSKSAVVPVDGGSRKVALYAVEAPENWFEDAGSGQLSQGSAHIDLDPTFAQTVNTAIDYHVFLTPNGDCKGLYVSQKSPTSFEVHELGGGTSSIAFDYRIMAKRTGYESIRLADLTERYKGLALKREQMLYRRGTQRSTRP